MCAILLADGLLLKMAYRKGQESRDQRENVSRVTGRESGFTCQLQQRRLLYSLCSCLSNESRRMLQTTSPLLSDPNPMLVFECSILLVRVSERSSRFIFSPSSSHLRQAPGRRLPSRAPHLPFNRSLTNVSISASGSLPLPRPPSLLATHIPPFSFPVTFCLAYISGEIGQTSATCIALPRTSLRFLLSGWAIGALGGKPVVVDGHIGEAGAETHVSVVNFRRRNLQPESMDPLETRTRSSRARLEAWKLGECVLSWTSYGWSLTPSASQQQHTTPPYHNPWPRPATLGILLTRSTVVAPDTPTAATYSELDFKFHSSRNTSMQFTALFACAAGSANATNLKWHAGAGCTGAVIATQPAAKAGQCVLLAKGRTARSISFNGAKGIDFFESGGKHDNCANGAQASSKKNSGCVTAPAGFNWASVRLR
ncbi:hypothetical protein MIND_01118100 [Mycena indigotica]|uniref:Uncharacterized protein n=1 Tax=Mycena indigotica TaxID=2126181 RepID=A0A8H6S7B1_9AGAR|nr:uncharacterized protein MIND_01118100 [Mycena indigotica]KAF7293411.1 hypothetical protein MIND_01118100 [Mycena indigotica]